MSNIYQTIQVVPVTDILSVIREEIKAALEIKHAPDEAFLKDAEAARRLKTSVATLRRWKSEGVVKSAIYAGNQRRCRVCDIEDYWRS